MHTFSSFFLLILFEYLLRTASYELKPIYSFLSGSLGVFDEFLSIELPVALAVKTFNFYYNSLFITFKVILLL